MKSIITAYAYLWILYVLSVYVVYIYQVRKIRGSNSFDTNKVVKWRRRAASIYALGWSKAYFWGTNIFSLAISVLVGLILYLHGDHLAGKLAIIYIIVLFLFTKIKYYRINNKIAIRKRNDALPELFTMSDYVGIIGSEIGYFIFWFVVAASL